MARENEMKLKKEIDILDYRESGEWGQPWTRTMAQKLQDFMNLLISVFDVDGDGIDEADLECLEVRRI